jgi:hypothetical protein
MAQSFNIPSLTTCLRTQLGNGADQLCLTPMRTGKHNTSYWVDCAAGHFVLRIAPADDAGLLFYERHRCARSPRSTV